MHARTYVRSQTRNGKLPQAGSEDHPAAAKSVEQVENSLDQRDAGQQIRVSRCFFLHCLPSADDAARSGKCRGCSSYTLLSRVTAERLRSTERNDVTQGRNSVAALKRKKLARKSEREPIHAISPILISWEYYVSAFASDEVFSLLAFFFSP